MPSTAPTPTQAPGHREENCAPPTPSDARYTQILDDLIDMGTALARRVHETAMAETTPATTVAEATTAFDRIARSVRRTIALARHIAAHPAPTAQAAAQAGQQARTRTQARAQIIRRVENAILTHGRVEGTKAQDADSLRAELIERLDDPALEFDLQSRPIDDIIAEISQDLGVARQGRSYIYQRRTPADVQALHTKAAAAPVPIPPLPQPTACTEHAAPRRVPWPPDP